MLITSNTSCAINWTGAGSLAEAGWGLMTSSDETSFVVSPRPVKQVPSSTAKVRKTRASYRRGIYTYHVRVSAAFLESLIHQGYLALAADFRRGRERIQVAIEGWMLSA
jgi:hypothetical protein